MYAVLACTITARLLVIYKHVCEDGSNFFVNIDNIDIP